MTAVRELPSPNGGVRRPPGPILMLIPCTADFSRRLVLAGEAWDHFSHRRPMGNSEPFDPCAGYGEAAQWPSPGRCMRRRRGDDSSAERVLEWRWQDAEPGSRGPTLAGEWAAGRAPRTRRRSDNP